MASAEPRSRRVSLVTALALLGALVATMLPLLRVIAIDAWFAGAVAIVALVIGAGYAARRLGLPTAVATVVEVAVWYLFTMLVFLAGTGVAAVIPTGATIDAVVARVQGAMQEIALGAAPLSAGPALTFCIVTAFGVLAIVLDHVVVTTRMPLLAAVALVAVWLIPTLIVPGRFDGLTFVALAAGILLLLRAETRTREGTRRSGPAGVVALGIGASAVVLALVVTPLLPAPPQRANPAGGGSALGINASLDLGRDLRQPRSTQVLTLRTSDAPRVPYLRVATLSHLDGDVWQPDASATSSLQGTQAFGPLPIDPGIETTQTTTTISVEGLASPWLPVPYAAVDITGLTGAWTVSPENRTLTGDGTTTARQTYTVVSDRAKPTLEQIRARSASGSGDDARYTALPDGMPAEIGDLARQVTADARSDYDRLLALQRWFRGPDFTYSLETPVAQGFDGSGVDAVARFLDVRKGYCVHFASAFTLMARSLGMPARIVVGYLPGTSTGDTLDDQRVYAVASSQLHAWPEVFFTGIGWVAFDPTKGLGEPTSFSSSATTTPGAVESTPGAEESAAPSATATPTPTPTTTAGAPAASGPAAGASDGLGAALPLGTLALLVVVALCLPSIAGVVRRRTLRAAALAGQAPAAWTLVQDAAIDVGIAVPASETPRAFAARLSAAHGIDPGPLEVLVSAIERDAYAPVRTARLSERMLSDEASAVRAAILAAVPPWRRALALAFPRSLAIRPGSAFAASGRAPRAG